MTKQEFEIAFNNAFKSTVEENSQTVISALSKMQNEYGKISTENLASTLFAESFKINSLFLKRLLESVIELTAKFSTDFH